MTKMVYLVQVSYHVLVQSRGAQRFHFEGCAGLDGVRRQLADGVCQVLITVLAGGDAAEAQWSAPSSHS